MLELYRRNSKAGILVTYIDAKENPNKFNMD